MKPARDEQHSKQIDLDPTAYRKQDPRTGRWLENVDKRLTRWVSIVGMIVICWFGSVIVQDGTHWVIPTFFGAFGFAIGGLFTLSLKRLDW